jgi:two-component system CheB/CheR fusion protein
LFADSIGSIRFQDIPVIKPERLARHFSQVDATHYRVQKSIRDLVVFSEQDLIKDPPFSKLDLLSCRNVLIYMGPELQQRLIPLFHYALNPRGVLFLGASESLGEFAPLFSPVDRAAKLYRREEGQGGAGHLHFWNIRLWPGQGRSDLGFRKGAEAKLPLRDITERALLDDGPAATLVAGVGSPAS